jgi:C1A family cysteine protease
MKMINYKFNCLPSKYDERDYRLSLKIEESIRASAIDWTDQMSPVKDQGHLGSCVGFAVASLKEWQERKENLLEGKDDKIYDFSEQWIYYNAKKIDGYPNEEGTDLRSAFKVLQKIGVPCEKGWKYNDAKVGEPESWSHLIARWAIIKSYERVTTVEQLFHTLNISPVVIGIQVFEEIMNVGKDGIVKDPRNSLYSLGGHAICLVGYDDAKGLFKFKNSWTKNWGQNGYGYLSYNYVYNYTLDAIYAVDMQVKKDMMKGKRTLV